MTEKTSKRIMRLSEVIQVTGLSRSTIYSLMRQGLFPKNFRLNLRACGWLESEVQDWLNSRIEISRPSKTPSVRM